MLLSSEKNGEIKVAIVGDKQPVGADLNQFYYFLLKINKKDEQLQNNKFMINPVDRFI